MLELLISISSGERKGRFRVLKRNRSLYLCMRVCVYPRVVRLRFVCIGTARETELAGGSAEVCVSVREVVDL